jgi:hypothetical protein
MKTFILAASFVLTLLVGLLAGLYAGGWSYSSSSGDDEVGEPATVYGSPALLNSTNKRWVSREQFARLSDPEIGEIYGVEDPEFNGKIVWGGSGLKYDKVQVKDGFSHPETILFLHAPRALGGGVCTAFMEKVALVDSLVVPVGWRLRPTERTGYTAYAFSGARTGAALPEQEGACAKATDASSYFNAEPAAALRGAVIYEHMADGTLTKAPGDAATLKAALTYEIVSLKTDADPLPGGGVEYSDEFYFSKNGVDYLRLTVVTDEVRTAAGTSAHVVSVEMHWEQPG